MAVTCDICGREDIFAVIMLEGAKMVACRGCARSGKMLYRIDEDVEDMPIAPKQSIKPRFADEYEVIEDYGARIKDAREKAGMKIDELAGLVNEKASYINSVEQQKLTLTIPAARKLENVLDIKLVEKLKEETSASSHSTPKKFNEPTLGDMFVSKKENE